MPNLRTNLQLNIAQFNTQLNRARQNVQRFSSAMAQASAGSASQTDRLIGSLSNVNTQLHKVGLGFRDVARIASGITVSQTFYTITNSIIDAKNALLEFNETLDYAHITYSALFNSAELSSSFLNTLKQFSVDTIFEYTDLEGMANKLSAYGIEYGNLMYIIEGLTNLGTISGDSAALERLAVAIGQINAKGVLKAEEVRQLANAYVPIYDILQDKLGMTEDDLKSIGDVGIPAATAIDAIVEYANERFGSVGDAAMYTITGLKNRIVDSLKVMGSDILQPITVFYKSFLKYTADSLQSLYDTYKNSGLGGVFEQLVPNEQWQQRIRQFIANIQNLFYNIAAWAHTVWPVVHQLLGGLLDALNVLMSVFNTLTSTLTATLQHIGVNTPLINVLTKVLVGAGIAWAFFKAQALGAAVISGLSSVIVGVAKAVVTLANVLMSNPIVTLAILLGAALTGVAASANSSNSALTDLFNTFKSYSAGGVGADDVLQVTDGMGENIDDSEQFWDSMTEGAKKAGEEIGGVGDSAKKAAKKAANSLLSFDEVFRLNDDSSGAGSGIGSGLGGALDDLTNAFGNLGQALIPDIPDLKNFASDFISTLYNDLWEALKVIGSGAATGAVIGGLVGFAIGGLVTRSISGAITGAKWGARIGTIAGAAFAGFWTDTYKELEDSLLKIATGGAIGTLAGGLIGMVIGAFATKTIDGALLGAKYGAGIGGLIGTGIGAFWAEASNEISSAIEGIVVGGAEGALVGGLTGLLIGAFSTRSLQGALTGAKYGAGIGTLIGGVFGGVFATASEELKQTISNIAWGSAEGVLVGGLAGMILGAFATRTLSGALTGAKYGAAIGGLLGGALGGIFGEAETTLGGFLSNMFANVSAASSGSLIGGLAGAIVGAVVGAFAGGIGAIPGAKAGAVIGAAAGALAGLISTYLQNAGVIDAITSWFNSLAKAIEQWLTSVLLALTTWFTLRKERLATWFTDIKEALVTWLASALLTLTTWFTQRKARLTTWFSDIKHSITSWFAERKAAIIAWFEDTKNTLSTWFTNRKTALVTWFNTVKSSVATWLTERKAAIMTWFTNLKSSISEWFTNRITDIKNWWSNLFDPSRWASGWSRVTTWFANTRTSISTWFTTLIQSIKTWWNNLFDTSNWTSGWSHIYNWFSNLRSSISTWFTNLKSSIGTWWSGLWDGKKVTVNASSSTSGGGVSLTGHAAGGIFNREHIARFAEGNKAEAVIPLEDRSAMQPFVTAISDGILQGLLPSLASSGGSGNDLPPMYVGTLIADERGIEQLFKKFEIYEAKELARKGLA